MASTVVGNVGNVSTKTDHLAGNSTLKHVKFRHFLNRTPLPTATHALWALKEMNLEEETSHLTELLQTDLSWWTKVYPPSEELHPPLWRDLLNEKLYTYLDKMNQPYALEELNLYKE